ARGDDAASYIDPERCVAVGQPQHARVETQSGRERQILTQSRQLKPHRLDAAAAEEWKNLTPQRCVGDEEGKPDSARYEAPDETPRALARQLLQEMAHSRDPVVDRPDERTSGDSEVAASVWRGVYAARDDSVKSCPSRTGS